MTWALAYSSQTLKDTKEVTAFGFKAKAEDLLKILAQDSLQNPPTFEKLVGVLAGAYSRQINIHNRLVYEIFPEENVVLVFRMLTHYE